MLRRLVTAAGVALLGLFVATGVASAAPGDPGYPPAGVITETVNVSTVTAGGTLELTGTGFLPGETVDITITYSGPSGLRSNAALRSAVSTGTMSKVVADSAGAFGIPENLTQVGTATITETGEASGRTMSLTVKILAVGSTDTAGTTTVAGSTATSMPSIGVAAGAGSDGSTGGGLASTGVSVAAPLAIGASALIAGLAMLFFGTRLAIRRNHGASSRS